MELPCAGRICVGFEHLTSFMGSEVRSELFRKQQMMQVYLLSTLCLGHTKYEHVFACLHDNT